MAAAPHRTIARLLLFLFVVLIPASTAPPTHHTYLPLVASRPSKTCVALPDDGNDLSAFVFNCYQGWTVTFEPVRGLTAVPHIPCNYPYWPDDPDVDFLELLRIRLAEWESVQGRPYDGPLLFLNEPDRWDQCLLSVEEAVIFYQEVRAICPSCQLTLPQVSDWDYRADWVWLRGFLAAYRGSTGQLPDVSYGAIHTYVQDEPAALLLESYKQLLSEIGYPPTLPILVTEWGACSPEVAMDMYRTFEHDGRIVQHFYFAPWFGSCTDLFAAPQGDVKTAVGDTLVFLHNTPLVLNEP